MIDDTINDGRTVSGGGKDVVLAAYGLAADTPESAIVAHLFGLYATLMKEKSAP